MDRWTEIAKLIGRTLKTLEQERPFDVVDVTHDEVTVRPTINDNERRIPREEIEGAFDELITLGVISRVDIEARYSRYNPAYVAAILAEMPGVQYSVKPISLWYLKADQQ